MLRFCTALIALIPTFSFASVYNKTVTVDRPACQSAMTLKVVSLNDLDDLQLLDIIEERLTSIHNVQEILLRIHFGKSEPVVEFTVEPADQEFKFRLMGELLLNPIVREALDIFRERLQADSIYLKVDESGFEIDRFEIQQPKPAPQALGARMRLPPQVAPVRRFCATGPFAYYNPVNFFPCRRR